MDGNRTRRTRITRPNRFEGGGAHQVLVHLRDGPPPYPAPQERKSQGAQRSGTEDPLTLKQPPQGKAGLPLDSEQVACAGV